ncbi:superoxide dismutase [Cohnella terricola]|uniref:superoxide dismutase n=1 Tax=Cohnella terricola TaxID=1289167 RepID=A0A559JTL5_9BACL|nr:Fe-Mn family superoxide dismutase [Cohnella terricola]TVY03224.1 superoxide dismutase [Cohnella terricola]
MQSVQSVYGTIVPLRLLEEIATWKAQEQENAAAIRSALPELEPAYSRWLTDWENVFAQTRAYADRVKNGVATERSSSEPGNEQGFYAGLLENSINQSREFCRQLQLLRRMSLPLSRAHGSHAVFAFLEREPLFIDGIMERLQIAGAIIPVLRQDSEEGTWSNPTGVNAPHSGNPVPIGGHQLPPLPYSYKALEPYIDEKTMRIHHDKHHLSYVEGLNTAEKKLQEARKSGDFDLVKHWERELAFNGAGHYLHTIFWNVMSPKGGGKPAGALFEEINRSFGSYDAFKRQFSEAAAKVEGGGWAILVWSPRSHRLEILTAEKHQNLSQWDVIPLLPLDVWEHAYYLKHQNDRAAYIKDWWNVVNWPYVADRFAKASTLQWTPY